MADIASATTDLFKILEPLEPTLRKRAIKAALTMLGDDTAVADEKSKGGAAGDTGEDAGEFNARTRTWMSRNKVTAEQLGHVFHIDGEAVEIIADKVPGNSGRDQVINAYVLMGIRELIRAGDPKFDDKTARDECERLGCHGKSNHATYLKSPGKVLSGSTKQGWTLTGPGMTAGAELIKGLETE